MKTTLLFESSDAAREVAWMLRVEWDGSNGVVSSHFDKPSLETAAGLLGVKWCWSFEECKLPLSLKEELLQSYSQGERYFGYLNLAGVDLSYQDLTGIHLASANLSGADLTGTELGGASLWDANLSNCKLVDANLSAACLNNASLARADVSNANLRYAHLSAANLQDADLSNANLCGAYLNEANLQRANLQGANLRSAFLPDANLQEANLCDAVLAKAFLYKANLYRAIFSRADLDRCSINRGANFKGAVLTFAVMPSGNIYGCVAKTNDALIDVLGVAHRITKHLQWK